MDYCSAVDILLFSHLQIWLEHIDEVLVGRCEMREDVTVGSIKAALSWPVFRGCLSFFFLLPQFPQA